MAAAQEAAIQARQQLVLDNLHAGQEIKVCSTSSLREALSALRHLLVLHNLKAGQDLKVCSMCTLDESPVHRVHQA